MIGRLGLVIRIEKQRLNIRIAGKLRVAQPREFICHAPHNKGGAVFAVEAGFHHPVIIHRLPPVNFIAGLALEPHIYFGKLHFQAQFAQPLHIGGDGLRVDAVEAEMPLQTDAMHRDAALDKILQHGIDGVRFGVHAFGTIIVVEKTRFRVGFVREAEGQFDIIIADHLSPGGIAQAGAAIRDSFVDHIPDGDAALIAPDHRHDMVAQQLNRFIAAELPGRQPFRHALVP